MRIRAGEIELSYEECGHGTPLVLTHGLGGDLGYWDGFIAALAPHHRLIRWDVRGSGGSDKPPGPYSSTMFADDLAALLDALAIERAHMLGASMGGVITQRFALDHPGRALSLILVSTSSEVGTAAVAAWQRLAALVEANGFGERAADPSRSFAKRFAEEHPEVVRALGDRTRRCDPIAYAAQARAVSDYNWTRELAEVDAPVLILQGLDDQLTPPGGSVKMSRVLPKARLLMVRAGGHNWPLEQPELFCSTVLSFTAGVDLSTI